MSRYDIYGKRRSTYSMGLGELYDEAAYRSYTPRKREELRVRAQVSVTYNGRVYAGFHVERLTEKAVQIKRGDKSAWFPKAALWINPKPEYLDFQFRDWFKLSQDQTSLFKFS